MYHDYNVPHSSSEPSLSTFQAIPLSDGRSMLVTWTLDYDGGPNITQFTIKVSSIRQRKISRVGVQVLNGKGHQKN